LIKKPRLKFSTIFYKITISVVTFHFFLKKKNSEFFTILKYELETVINKLVSTSQAITLLFKSE